MQVDIERLIGDAHRAATQLDWFPVLRRQQLVMLKARRPAVRRSLKRLLRRRLAGVGLLAGQHIADKADGTEVQSARKRLAAARADGLTLGAHSSQVAFGGG